MAPRKERVHKEGGRRRELQPEDEKQEQEKWDVLKEFFGKVMEKAKGMKDET